MQPAAVELIANFVSSFKESPSRSSATRKSADSHTERHPVRSLRGESRRWQILFAAVSALLLAPVSALAADAAHQIDPSIFRLSIFVIAIFVGYYVVWSVTPALHTPLMSVTNAISSVIVVGALLAVTANTATAYDPGAALVSRILGFFALTMVSVNIFGGFLVTQRMLAMYKKKDK